MGNKIWTSRKKKIETQEKKIETQEKKNWNAGKTKFERKKK